jgi:hypothetical protein
MDGGNSEQAPKRAAINKLYTMKASNRLNEIIRRAWNRTLIPAAEWLNNWQNKVSMKTRNRWLLSILGILFTYALLSLIILFI